MLTWACVCVMIVVVLRCLALRGGLCGEDVCAVEGRRRVG